MISPSDRLKIGRKVMIMMMSGVAGSRSPVTLIVSCKVLVLILSLVLILLPAESHVKCEDLRSKSDTDAYRLRFRGLDRILNRLDAGSGGGSGSGSDPAKSYRHGWLTRTASHQHQQSKDDESRPLEFRSSTPSPYESHSFKNGSKDAFGVHTATDIHNNHNNNESLDEEDDPDFGEEEDDDEDDSYEYEDERPLLNDRMESWANVYKNKYARQHGIGIGTPSTTSTTTTTTSTTTTTTTPAPSYSEWKWSNLGSRQAVERTRNLMAGQSRGHQPHSPPKQTESVKRHPSPEIGGHRTSYNQNHNNFQSPSLPQPNRGSVLQQQHISRSLTSEAFHHAYKVQNQGACRIPQPRVVRVQDFYMNPSKTYMPHCTILHRCSDETGCCKHDGLSCSVKTQERVELAFYTYYMDQSRSSMVEKLVFYNHTECECRDRMEETMPRDSPSLSQSAPVDLPRYRKGFEMEKDEINCRCPSSLTPRILPGGSCSCDCFDKEVVCLKMKHGKDFFPLKDKWCIQSGRCEVPECSYGPYIHLIGKCPRKGELSRRSTSWTRYLNNAD